MELKLGDVQTTALIPLAVKAMKHCIRLIGEHSFNEEMRKYSIRGKLFALLLPKMNDRWATFRW